MVSGDDLIGCKWHRQDPQQKVVLRSHQLKDVENFVDS